MSYGSSYDAVLKVEEKGMTEDDTPELPSRAEAAASRRMAPCSHSQPCSHGGLNGISVSIGAPPRISQSFTAILGEKSRRLENR